MIIAIPRLEESVAPCFEYGATITFFTVKGKQIIEQIDVPLKSRDPFDRVRLMKAKQVDTVICGGVQSVYEDLLEANDMQVISWVSGKVEELVALFLEGQLSSGTARLGDVRSMDDEGADTGNHTQPPLS